MLKQASFREEILAEGKEEGRLEGIKEMIKIMFSNGMSMEQIAKAVSIPKDIIEEYATEK